MIRLKWLKLRAFRSFADEVRIDFPQSGLVLIRGQNQTNHDSSGTGKSTILLAISYALDMCPFPASELQSWLTEDPMQVQVGFDSPLGEVVINRGKRNSLKIGDQDSITGAKAISEGVRKLFGLDTETLRAITYRPQNTSGLFLELTDSEKKEFLTKILGLESIEKAVAHAEAQMKLLEPALAAEEAAIQQIETELATLRAQEHPSLQDYGELTLELNGLRSELGRFDQQIREVQARGDALRDQASTDPELLALKSFLELITAKGQEAVKANAERHREFQARQEQLRRKLQEITRQESRRQQLQVDINTKRNELAHALEGKCSMCFRTWDQAAKKAEEIKAVVANYEAMLQAMEDLTSERRQTEEALREVFVTDPILEQFRFKQNDLEAQYQQKKLDLTLGPQEEARGAIQSINIKRSMVTARIQSITEQISTIETMNRKLDQARKFVETNIKTNEGRLDGRQKIALKLRAELNAERDFLALMGREGFLGVIFDDVLREIEVEANERLGRLANVSHVTIHFKSEVETQKGTVQRKIVPVVSVNGVEAKLRSGLSGGMYTSVEGVVDLAVMSVVQRRTGAIPGFLFLDESFNGQGNATKEAAMEVLREYGNEKLVIVIDHNSEFKEMFTQFIDVTFRDGRSGVV